MHVKIKACDEVAGSATRSMLAAWIFHDIEDAANWSISPALAKPGRNSTLRAPQPDIRAEVSA